MNIEVLIDVDAVAHEVAAFIAAEARGAVAARGQFMTALRGGHMPWLMLRALVGEGVSWPNVHVVQVDERVARAASGAAAPQGGGA